MVWFVLKGAADMCYWIHPLPLLYVTFEWDVPNESKMSDFVLLYIQLTVEKLQSSPQQGTTYHRISSVIISVSTHVII